MVVTSEAPCTGFTPAHPQAKNNEEGLRLMEDLAHCFRDVHLWWLGPFHPVVRLIHPKFVVPLLQASGISPRSPNPSSFLLPLQAPPTPEETRLSRGTGSIDRDLLLTL